MEFYVYDTVEGLEGACTLAEVLHINQLTYNETRVEVVDGIRFEFKLKGFHSFLAFYNGKLVICKLGSLNYPLVDIIRPLILPEIVSDSIIRYYQHNAIEIPDYTQKLDLDKKFFDYDNYKEVSNPDEQLHNFLIFLFSLVNTNVIDEETVLHLVGSWVEKVGVESRLAKMYLQEFYRKLDQMNSVKIA